MRYEEFYNEQVIKYKKRRAFLTKKLPFILIGSVILLSLILVLFFTSGTPYEYGIADMKFGDTIQNTPKSFLASAKYEFLVDGEYIEEAPTKPGTYSYRIASTNVFGITKYSEDFEFVIEKGKAIIQIEDTEVNYGFEPKKITSNLPYDQKIASYTIEYTDKHQLTTEAWVSDVTIVDSNGLDITSYYDLEFPKTTITIVKAPLVIKLVDKEKEYDGKALEYENEDDYIIEGLINGDEEIEITTEGSQTLVGESTYSVSSVVIKDKNGNTYETYDYVFESGTLTVYEKEISFITEDTSTTYNGETQEFNSYTLSEEIPDSVVVDLIEVNLAGKYSYELTPTFINSDGVDVSDCYIVNYTYGEIEVKKAQASIKLGDIEEEYSGLVSFNSTYTVDSGDLFGATLTVKVDSSIREVGEGITSLNSYTITKNDVDVSNSFILSFIDGTIKITKKDLMLKPKGAEKEYDGLSYSTTKYEQEGLVSGDTLSVTSTCDDVEIGTKEFYLDLSTLSITHNGNDVSLCYNIIEDSGLLTITKRNLNIWVYGNDITYGETPTFTYVCGVTEGLLDGDTLVVNSYLYTEEIGENEIDTDDYEILNGTDDHSYLYDVFVVKSKYTISKKQLAVSLASKSKTYDGEELGVLASDYYISSGELLSTDNITFIPSPITIIYVGTKVISISMDNVEIKNNNNQSVTHCYDIEYLTGSITITPRAVNITTGSITKEFDFDVLTCDEVIASGIITGHVLEVEITGELFYVGEAKNTVGKIRVYSSNLEDRIDLTENYTFKVYEGTLTYTERSA